MSEEIPEATPPLTAEQRTIVSRLTDSDIQAIDDAILAQCSQGWYKVARVVMWAKDALNDRYPDVPKEFFSERLIQLAEDGRLDSQGDLRFMRFSEVRLPAMQ